MFPSSAWKQKDERQHLLEAKRFSKKSQLTLRQTKINVLLFNKKLTNPLGRTGAKRVKKTTNASSLLLLILLGR